MKHVYEFTNQRKLTKAEFLRWFQKKVLYTIRKFQMIKSGDIIAYENKGDFRSVVLEDVLKMFSGKADVEIVKLSTSSFPPIHPNKSASLSKQLTKRAVLSTTDTESDKLVHELIKGNVKNLKELGPVVGKIIKPLYLFLDKEVLLYAKLKKLKYTLLSVPQGGASTSSRPQSTELRGKKDKISNFIDDLEQKHPEIKHAIINSYLEIFK